MPSFTHFIACLALCMGLCAQMVPAYAAEESSPSAKAETGKDAAKGEKGGETEGDKKAPVDISGGRFAGDPVYVHLAPMVMPIITEDGVEQIVTIAIDIQVKDFDTADSIHSNMPRVMDALMRGLYGGLSEGRLRNGKLVNIAKIKNKAIHALTEVVGGDGIKDVLIQGVAQRML